MFKSDNKQNKFYVKKYDEKVLNIITKLFKNCLFFLLLFNGFCRVFFYIIQTIFFFSRWIICNRCVYTISDELFPPEKCVLFNNFMSYKLFNNLNVEMFSKSKNFSNCLFTRWYSKKIPWTTSWKHWRNFIWNLILLLQNL